MDRPGAAEVPHGAYLATPLSVLVSAFALVAVVVSAIGMAIGGEPYRGTDLAAAGAFGGLGLVVVWLGLRAHRRWKSVDHRGLAVLARMTPWLTAVGATLGLAAGVWIVSTGLAAKASIDDRACSWFSGPLEPRAPEACRVVARVCRLEVESGPEPELPRGVQAAAAPPAGLDLPTTAEARAVALCMHAKSSDFVRQ